MLYMKSSCMHSSVNEWMNDNLLIILCAYMSIHKCCCLVLFRVRWFLFLARLYSTHVTYLSISLWWTTSAPKVDTTIVEPKLWSKGMWSVPGLFFEHCDWWSAFWWCQDLPLLQSFSWSHLFCWYLLTEWSTRHQAWAWRGAASKVGLNFWDVVVVLRWVSPQISLGTSNVMQQTSSAWSSYWLFKVLLVLYS